MESLKEITLKLNYDQVDEIVKEQLKEVIFRKDGVPEEGDLFAALLIVYEYWAGEGAVEQLKTELAHVDQLILEVRGKSI